MTFTLTSPGCPIGPAGLRADRGVRQRARRRGRRPLEDGLLAAVDARAHERRSEVRARLLSIRALTVLQESFADDPALDVAVSRAVMFRVAAGELPETLRIARPAAVVAFAKRDALADGYERAVQAAAGEGFGAVLRLAGGRAAVFHEGTLEVAHAAPGEDPRAGIHERFAAVAALTAARPGRPRRRCSGGRGPGRVLPGPLERQRVGAAQARRDRAARGLGRLAHRLGDRRERRGPDPARARAGLLGALARLGSGDGGSGRRRGARNRAGRRSGTPCSPSTDGCSSWCPARSTQRRSRSRASSPPSTGHRPGSTRQPPGSWRARSSPRWRRRSGARAGAACRGPSRGWRGTPHPGSHGRWPDRRGTGRAGRRARG